MHLIQNLIILFFICLLLHQVIIATTGCTCEVDEQINLITPIQNFKIQRLLLPTDRIIIGNTLYICFNYSG